MRTQLMLIAGAVFAAAQPLCAVDGTVLATTADPCLFRLDTSGETPIVVSSQEELSGLMPIGWGKGDSVVATAPDGTTYQIISGASSSGSMSVSQYIDAAGVWLLENSTLGTVKAGVQWSVFGGGQLAASDAKPFVADTVRVGPNRRGGYSDVWPAIAYTGDDWGRNSVLESTVTLVSPKGDTITTNFTGNGVMAFSPKQTGRWSVTLVNDSQTLEGAIFISPAFLMRIQ